MGQWQVETVQITTRIRTAWFTHWFFLYNSTCLYASIFSIKLFWKLTIAYKLFSLQLSWEFWFLGFSSVVGNKPLPSLQLFSHCMLVTLACHMGDNFSPVAHAAMDKYLSAFAAVLAEKYRWDQNQSTGSLAVWTIYGAIWCERHCIYCNFMQCFVIIKMWNPHISDCSVVFKSERTFF